MAAAKAAANRRPIVIRRVKKIVGGHHGGAWKVAYADFVTAMMAFFMLLWLISNPDKQRKKGLAEYFSPATTTSINQPGEPVSSAKGVGGMPGAGGQNRRAQSDSQVPAAGEPAIESGTKGTARGGTASVPGASLRVLAQEMKVSIDTTPQDVDGHEEVRVESDRDGLRIVLMDNARRSLFRAGTATLNPFARAMIARVADKLAKSNAQIAIEGHTDGDGLARGVDANWRLSGDRAIAAWTALVAAGLPADRFAELVAMADTRPLYPDQPGRPENRRITIVVKGAAPALPTDTSFRF
jgi:chemotaxis protein MotB